MVDEAVRSSRAALAILSVAVAISLGLNAWLFYRSASPSGGPTASAQTQEQLNQERAALRSLAAQVSQIEAALNATSGPNASVAAVLAGLQLQLTSLNDSLSNTAAASAQQQAEVLALKTEVAALNAEIGDLQAGIPISVVLTVTSALTEDESGGSWSDLTCGRLGVPQPYSACDWGARIWVSGSCNAAPAVIWNSTFGLPTGSLALNRSCAGLSVTVHVLAFWSVADWTACSFNECGLDEFADMPIDLNASDGCNENYTVAPRVAPWGCAGLLSYTVGSSATGSVGCLCAADTERVQHVGRFSYTLATVG